MLDVWQQGRSFSFFRLAAGALTGGVAVDPGQFDRVLLLGRCAEWMVVEFEGDLDVGHLKFYCVIIKIT